MALCRGGSRIFFRRGCSRRLHYFNANKPHFFLQNTSCIRKPQVISGGGVRTPCTLPLDLPLLCISQIEASTSPRATPRAFDFFENYCSNPPLPRPKCPSKCPTRGSVQVIKCPHPEDISQAHKWQKDGRNAFSCRTRSL